MNLGISESAKGKFLPNQYMSLEQLLQEGNKNTRQIKEQLCCSSALDNLVILNYQVIDCNGDPVGDPLSVLPTISMSKQDVSLCNVDELATAIALAITLGSPVFYNIPNIYELLPDTTTALVADLGVDVTKLHSIAFTVYGTMGTLAIAGTLGGGVQTITAAPSGVSGGFPATTVFGTGDITFTITGDATVLISTISKA
jgi:hypothetical protein